jgi:uncharacterized protein
VARTRANCIVSTIASTMANDFAVIIFAKAPVPGEAKTRLIPALGAEHAALLHAALTERAIESAMRADAAWVELCATPGVDHAFFANCEDDFDVELAEQGDGDLGARMLRALNRTLADDANAVLIGADCPALTPKLLNAAALALQTHDVVLVPAEDGGYTLVGARRTHPAMFDGIAWGTGTVLSQQRAQLAACSLSWCELETLWDVDRPEDIPRVKALMPPLDFFWPT